MSMKGLLPGLSNFAFGTIGSCQYRTLRPASAVPAFVTASIFGAGAGSTGTCRVPNQ
jgi:hypothetical protein